MDTRHTILKPFAIFAVALIAMCAMIGITTLSEDSDAATCPVCHGTGEVTCPDCNGSGYIEYGEDAHSCTTCGGTGEGAGNPSSLPPGLGSGKVDCSTCGGTGTVADPEPDPIPVTSISISGSSSGEVGDRITLTATTSPSNADNRHVTWSITSGSSRAEIVRTIDSTSGGRCEIEALSAGDILVRATAADGSGEYATKTITIRAADVEITSSQGDTTISTGTAFSYVVNTNVSGCTISVSGADWLQVSGNTVYGTPTEAGDFDITITASKSGYTSDTQSFSIKVVFSLSFTSVPTTGLIIVEV